MFDIFAQDAFKVTRLTEAMREIKYAPSLISSLGLFQTSSIDTLDFVIEKDKEQNLFLIQSSPRGAPGQTFGRNRRSMRKLSVPHYQVNDALYADEVQAVRAFASETQVESLMTKIAERAAEASQSFALSEERQRLEIIKTGTLLDADGSTMYDFFTEMGESQASEIDFDLDNANPAEGALRKKVMQSVQRPMAATLDGLPFNGIMAFCGDAFWDDLISHSEVRETYKGYAAASTLRTAFVDGNGMDNSFGSMDLFGIRWINYRSGQSVGVHTDKVHFVPTGVPNLFRSVYAPADYMDTVNKPGQRLYAKQWVMDNEKGVNLEFQTNVVHYCTRPRVLLRGKRT